MGPTRHRRTQITALAVALVMVVAGAAAAPVRATAVFRPGAAGVGDAYFPLEGNGGYDVSHYALNLDFNGLSWPHISVANLLLTGA